MKTRILSLVYAVLALCAAVTQAQTAGTGTIQGRVLNPATNEYIRNVEVRIQGTNQVVSTEDGGYYQLHNVPAGTVTLVATYPGADSVTTTVSVEPGATAVKDLEVVATGARQTGENIVRLGAFVVETEREGQAKALAEQQQAMNVKTVMSSENFGDMSEGNIGEFLKYMPGITIDYVETDTRAASMGGMDPKYGYVTLDGNTQASGSSGSFGDAARQFEFESVSMNNIESIEVNKTLSADMSADAPAGTVNLRTRSPLDKKRRQIGYTVGLIANSEEYGFKREPRHDDGLHAKTRPRFSFDYSDAFFDRKLGITVNGQFTNIYKEQFRHSLAHDYTSTAARNAGTPLITALNYKDGPKIVEKSAGGVRLDYQPFVGLRMSAGISYSWFNDFFANRNLNFVTTSALLGAGSSLTRVVANTATNTNTRVDQSGESTGKLKDSTNLSYAANYKRGPWTADLSLLYSRQRESRGGAAYGTMGRTDVRLGRIGFTAERPSVDSPSWYIVQTGGPDWFNYANYGKDNTQAVNTNETYGKTEEYTAKLDFRRVMAWELPTSYKFGVSERVTFRHRKFLSSYTGTYVGPTGNPLTSGFPQSKATFFISEGFGGNINGLPVPDKEAMWALLQSSPQYFVQSEANMATDLQNMIGGYQGNQESIRSYYLMQESRIGSKWRVQAGIRNEQTSTRSRVPDELPVNRNPFAIRGTTTIGGVQRQTFTAANTRDYVAARFSPGIVTSYGEYDDWMPSASAKFQLTKDINFKFGFNKAIKRPNLNNIAGPWEIDLNNTTGDLTVTIPNPALKPERSTRYSIAAEYYFKPAGSLSLHVFQTDITGAADETDPIPAAEFGFGDDPEYGSAFFTTFVNLNERRRFRGIELSYSQQLTFLRHELLRGTSVFATYSQRSVSPRPRNGRFFPRSATGGVTWKYNKFFVQVNGTWTDETFTGGNTVPAASPYTPNAPEYLKDRTILFVNFRYRFHKNNELFISGDRAYDSGKTWFYKADGRIRQTERYGSQWSIGIKGDY